MEAKKTGRGLAAVQIESRLAADRLEALMNQFQGLYEKWHDKNRFASCHRHYEIFDPILDTVSTDPKDALRCIFVLMRGGKGAFLYEIIRKLQKSAGLTEVTIPDEERGRIALINKRYLDWADANLPPTLIELHWSAMVAEENANESWGAMVAPSIETSYGGTYFIGTLSNAVDYNQVAAGLRKTIKKRLMTEQDQWKDSK